MNEDSGTMTQASEERGFTFPSTLEVSVLGKTDDALELLVPEILLGVGVSVVEGSLRTRMSREGHYRSVGVAFFCPDRVTYDTVHQALRAHPAVKWTL